MKFSHDALLKSAVLAVSCLALTACPAPCDISDADADTVYRDAIPIVQSLEKFHTEKKDYPAQLNELSPSFLSKVPEKFGSRKFIYARLSNDKYTLRISDSGGGFYSGSCSISEVKEVSDK